MDKTLGKLPQNAREILSCLWIASSFANKYFSSDSRPPVRTEAGTFEDVDRSHDALGMVCQTLVFEEKRPAASLGYRSSSNAIWIRARELTGELYTVVEEPKTTDKEGRLPRARFDELVSTFAFKDLFGNGKKVQKDLLKLYGKGCEPFESWVKGNLNVAQYLGASDIAVCRRILGNSDYNPFQFSGYVLIGIDAPARDGFVWIGVRRDKRLLHSSTLRAYYLRHPATFVQPFPDFKEVPSWLLTEWWKTKRQVVLAKKSACQAACDTLLGVPGVPGELQHPHSIVTTFQADTLHLNADEDSDPSLQDLLREHKEFLSSKNERHLIISTDLSYDKAAEKLLAALGAQSRPGLNCLIFTRNDLLSCLSKYPWIWSKHFGETEDFQIVNVRDADHLAQAFFPTTETPVENPTFGDALGGHPKPAMCGHLKTGHMRAA